MYFSPLEITILTLCWIFVCRVYILCIFKNKVKWSEVAQSCLTLCDPMDCSPPGSSVHGVFQAWILEWVAVSFSRVSSLPRDRTRVSLIVGRHFTIWATREAPYSRIGTLKFFKFIYIYFWLRWVLIILHKLSPVEVNGVYSLLWCMGFSLRWLLSWQGTSSRHVDSVVADRRLWSRKFWHTGLVSLWHMGSSWIRDWTCIPCIVRQILNQWTTREAQE